MLKSECVGSLLYAPVAYFSGDCYERAAGVHVYLRSGDYLLEPVSDPFVFSSVGGSDCSKEG